MHPSQNPAELNYYDALGVAPDAAPEEIRDAFRSLVRLLHPDQQTDGPLKDIAERQMRKLNPIYAVLSDPERRRIYDEDLADGYPPAIIVNSIPSDGLRRLAGRLVWVAAILVGAGLLYWFASDNAAAPQIRVYEQTAAAASPEPSSLRKVLDNQADQDTRIDRLQLDLHNALAQRDAAISELNRLRGAASAKADPIAPPPAAAPVVMAELPSPPPKLPLKLSPPAPALSSRIDAAPPSRRPLAGVWSYVKPPAGPQSAKDRAAYPPEYIEASISDENGTLHGKYRSRFRIVDRAISPDVNFTFTASSAGSTITCPWTGPGGAHGELTLKLLPDNLLRVDWMAVDLGTEQGLASGSAILTRKTE